MLKHEGKNSNLQDRKKLFTKYGGNMVKRILVPSGVLLSFLSEMLHFFEDGDFT